MVKSRFKRNDVRVRKRIYRKYGEKQRLKVQRLLHNISKHVVEDAKAKQFGIVMEDLTNIRKLYRRGSWQAREYRARMNGWSFRELQRQIEYKALWEGIPVYHVNARGTSSTCATCGCSCRPNAQRTLQCPNGHVSDRDVNAAKNILKRGMRFVPLAHPVEAMVQERNNAVPTLDSRWM
jgi:putative transposase